MLLCIQRHMTSNEELKDMIAEDVTCSMIVFFVCCKYFIEDVVNIARESVHIIITARLAASS